MGFDFASDGRSEGDRAGINDKGLVTYDRLHKKDAFYWYKANWSLEPMAHITSKRLKNRTTAEVELKVYSNLKSLAASVNGKEISMQTSANRIFKWNISLSAGENVILVKNEDNKIFDSVVWEFQ